MRKISENLYVYEDTCNVYVVKHNERAVLIDFGSGDVLDHLDEVGVSRVIDVLLTHHHRDQAQGLARAVEAGADVWVPHTEQDLISGVDDHWQSREIYNNYNMRQDRFSILYSVPISGTLKDYSTYRFEDYEFTVAPTPGHTIGSISLLANIDGDKVAFTGDLISAPGKMWSLSTTQWTYNGAEGVPYSVLSLLSLKEKNPDCLCPSHGEVMADPKYAIDLLVERLKRLLNHRNQAANLLEVRENPYEEITPHLLRNRTSWAHSYVLISESGKALVIDYGYDFMVGLASGADRASRRPWLYNIDKLKKDYGVEKVDVALLTHFHDDHVGGLNVLRDVEGTEVWAAENFSDILENPDDYDLPCIWYDPIKVDRKLPLEKTLRWEEYEFTLYEQSGHTLYAVAIAFEADGKRVLAIGDQYQDTNDNYVYKNGFRAWDYRDSAELYNRLKPDLLISGHSNPLWTNEEIFQELLEKGKELEEIHRELLPEEIVAFQGDGTAAFLTPYQTYVDPEETFTLTATVKNPYESEEIITISLEVPSGWKVWTDVKQVSVPAGCERIETFTITAPDVNERRARVAANITIGDKNFGQQAEALVTVSGGEVVHDERKWERPATVGKDVAYDRQRSS
ncbi:MAG TPA: MBL fold metallo-hydrolase [Bacillales bacterium]|nr:MBL fold metallo-hydrolase [Bacillales bacterium]